MISTFAKMNRRLSFLLVLAMACSARAEFPNQRREKISIRFPDGFKVVESKDGKFDASNGDVLVAVAKDEYQHEIRVFHASYVPVSDDEVPRFVQVMTAFFGGKPNTTVFASRVTRINGRNWGRVEMEANGAAPPILIYSLDGSPSRIELRGPISDAPIITKLADKVIGSFSDKAKNG